MLSVVLTFEVSARDSATYAGCCGTSAAVSVDGRHFLVADDEDNKVRLYARESGGEALSVWDFGRQLAFSGRDQEADIEGAARLGSTVYWIGSHGRNKDGEFRQARHTFFATELQWQGSRLDLKFVGRPYRFLVEEMIRDRRFDFAGLRSASEKKPKAEGALNIEALCARFGGGLWIGFRNPVPNGKALLVPITNPSQVVQGEKVIFSDPVQIDLRGKGFRDMVWDGNRYWILAGEHDGKGQTLLFTWDGSSTQPERVSDASMKGLNPEALVLPPKEDSGWLTVLSDDGSRNVRGKPCKDLPPSSRRFRSVDLKVDAR